MKDQVSRRKFLGTSAIGAVGVIGAAGLASACASDKVKVSFTAPPKKADSGTPIKAALIGCGGRGTGALMNLLDAADGVEIVALADLFEDKISSCRNKLKDQKGVEVPDEKCFLGFDAYQKVLEEDINYLLIATPPHFRPEHFEAAVKARKNVFMEKPVAVDPVGARRILVAGKQAESMGLSVVAGTQRRHQWHYLEVNEYVKAGAIGDFVAGYAYWNQNKLWHVNPKAEWSEMEAMIRNWVNWMWLSGDHIVEQHVHNIDVINWFKNAHPVKAVGFGSRQRRITGDQFDNFSVDFVYDDDTHMHSMCRQINGTANNVSEFLRGTKGYTDCSRTIYNNDGTVYFETENPWPAEESAKDVIQEKYNSPYVQEHVDLVNTIRRGEQIVEAENVATSTLTAIMGRISAYTGKETTWDEMMNADLHYTPDVYDMGPVKSVPKDVPVPGDPAEE
ncbi:MAG: Gfo/Idh/MocA family oxidoreductase [Bacteroidales bacterium]|nr:Gfo/Idh/MocA family oxidoreductase [Bacteroidales bacterium]